MPLPAFVAAVGPLLAQAGIELGTTLAKKEMLRKMKDDQGKGGQAPPPATTPPAPAVDPLQAHLVAQSAEDKARSLDVPEELK